MSNETSEGAMASGDDQLLAQTEKVRIFVSFLEKCWRAARVNDYVEGNEVLDNLYRSALQVLNESFDSSDNILISIKPSELYFGEQSIYKGETPKTSLSFQLFDGGLRVIRFLKGYDRVELIQIVKLLAVDLQKPEMMDQDLYALFVENTFPHFECSGSDLLTETQKRDPQLKEDLKSYVSRIAYPILKEKPQQPRKLKEADLKAIQEFQINPDAFKNTGGEAAKISKALLQKRESSMSEQEKCERLASMGLHFLMGDEIHEDRAKVGREILLQAALIALDSGLIEFFISLLSRLRQLQIDNQKRREDYEKIVESLFEPSHYSVFASALGSDKTKQAVLDLLLAAPRKVVRIVILLLGKHPWLGPQFSDAIIEELPNHLDWLNEEAKREPDHPAWGYLVGIISQKPSQQLQGFLNLMINSSNPAMRLKLYKQLLSIGTPDSLRTFDQILNSDDHARRLELWEFFLANPPNSKMALRMLKTHIEADRFLQTADAEKTAAYSLIAKLGGEHSWPFFQQRWLENQKRLLQLKGGKNQQLCIVKSLIRGCPKLIALVLETTPLERMDPEVASLIMKAGLHKPTGGTS